jgi:adenylate cyclase
VNEARVERKLTTVLCADAAGYSRLMDEDEEATLALLTEHRETFTGFIARHRGTLVNTAGDSVLADFPSVVEAVQCALEVQRELGARNSQLPENKRLDFRIGINLGDVMVKNGDLFGEGVNIASRLEQIATPGGICVSGPVYEQVHNKLSVGFEFLGPRSVKNIAEQVPVYRLKTGVEQGRAAPAEKVSVHRRRDFKYRGKRRRHETGTEDDTVEAQVMKQVARLRRFYRHLTWYGALVGFLFLINLVTSTKYWWFFWPAFGLGIPLVAHALRVFVFTDQLYGRKWEERKTRELRERMEREADS